MFSLIHPIAIHAACSRLYCYILFTNPPSVCLEQKRKDYQSEENGIIERIMLLFMNIIEIFSDEVLNVAPLLFKP